MAPKEAKKDGGKDKAAGGKDKAAAGGKKEGGKDGGKDKAAGGKKDDKAKEGKKDDKAGGKKDDKGGKKDDKGGKKDDKGKDGAKKGDDKGKEKKGDDKGKEKKGDDKSKEKKTDAKAEKKDALAGKEAEAGEGGETEAKKRAPFRRFFYRGLEVHKLLDLTHAELMKLMTSRIRRRFARGQIPMGLVRKLRKEKNAAAKAGEKPKTIKTHHRNMIIVPEMVGSMVGVYNGLNFTQVEIKPDMIGHYLGEFSITYKPVKHGRPGVGATGTAKLIPLK
jgi:small subunit ribosomal protein S15e